MPVNIRAHLEYGTHAKASDREHDPASRMNFELKFSSNKGSFSLTVQEVALLDKSRIPLSFLVAQESIITTTDEAAIRLISDRLLPSPLGHVGETRAAMLVRANESQWLVFGRRGDVERRPVMKVIARMIAPIALGNYRRPTLQPGESAFLVKKVRSALDEHTVKSRKKRRVESPILPDPSIRRETPSQVIEETIGGHERGSRAEQKTESSGTGRKNREGLKDTASGLNRSESAVSTGKTAETREKVVRDKLKKMIVTLLSLRGVSKKDEAFKDLYQHTLQAATFALRTIETVDLVNWEAQAMTVSQVLLKVFLEPLTTDG